ncbi:DUF445 domain-containing protein [Thalassobacillus sp. CUG 92003]|uniref:DUF445 domain-containing protein n=1 Tax=Thalassobacillus sp. CUG 92003 TaxID=2736641 RepID=UPI0015E6963E|nr:DUF445 family protein [Thalassobacillus sp. CUG 92003]
MNAVMLIGLMFFIGALIGGVTNSLAIRMLFRPFQAKYMGNFRLPFTPGLIPKRQKELAEQLGRMVVQHLLTAEGLRKKLKHSDFQEQLVNWGQDELEHVLNREESAEEMLARFNVDVSKEEIEKKLASWVEERYETTMKEWRHHTVKEMLPEHLQMKAQHGIATLSEHIQRQLSDYLNSQEGRMKISALIENYLQERGVFGSMISSFVSPENMTDRIHPAILQYVNAGETREWLHELLTNEWQVWLNKPIGEIERKIGADTISSTLGVQVANVLPINDWLNRSVADWTKPYRNVILQQGFPVLVDQFINLLSDRIEQIMDNLHLSTIVQEEVESFSVERLEDMVLGISRREFKMITFLGALLGGMIGIIQGILVMFIG